MNWADCLFWALVVVCVLCAVGVLSNLACWSLFGMAEELPQTTRSCDMRLVADQTRRIQAQAFDDSVRKSTERRAALVKQKLEAVRLEGLAAALHDLAHGTRTECPYKGGSKSSLNWHIAYNRAKAECSDHAEQKAA